MHDVHGSRLNSKESIRLVGVLTQPTAGETDGTWKAGNLLKKLVEQMRLYEKASFTVRTEYV